MGTWGAENFQNDDAREYLNSVIEYHIDTIKNCLESAEQNLLNCGESKLMPSADILLLLCEFYSASLPVSEVTVREWKERYLRIFAERIDGYKPDPDYKLKRLKVIEDTFDLLEGYVAQ
jgi:hypothetical protein